MAADFYRQLTQLEEKELRRMRDEFRLVFESELGQRVLTAILGRILGFFGDARTDEERVLQNAARQLLYCIGAWDDDEVKIVRRLLSRQ